jgi:hypothetical protein
MNPPGRDEYFLVNLGSMSAQESTHRATCITNFETSLCALRHNFFSLRGQKVLIPASVVKKE